MSTAITNLQKKIKAIIDAIVPNIVEKEKEEIDLEVLLVVEFLDFEGGSDSIEGVIYNEKLIELPSKITISSEYTDIYRKLYFVTELTNYLRKNKLKKEMIEFTKGVLNDKAYKISIQKLYKDRSSYKLKSKDVEDYDPSPISSNNEGELLKLLNDISNLIDSRSGMKTVSKNGKEFRVYKQTPSQYMIHLLETMEKIYYHRMRVDEKREEALDLDELQPTFESFFRRQANYMLYHERKRMDIYVKELKRTYDEKKEGVKESHIKPARMPGGSYFGEIMSRNEINPDEKSGVDEFELYEDVVSEFLQALSTHIHMVKSKEIKEWILYHIFYTLDTCLLSKIEHMDQVYDLGTSNLKVGHDSKENESQIEDKPDARDLYITHNPPEYIEDNVKYYNFESSRDIFTKTKMKRKYYDKYLDLKFPVSNIDEEDGGDDDEKSN